MFYGEEIYDRYGVLRRGDMTDMVFYGEEIYDRYGVLRRGDMTYMEFHGVVFKIHIGNVTS